MKNTADTIRIVHVADLHLGSGFSRFPGQADILQQEHFDAFLSLLEQCEQEKPDLLLIAGDLFEQPDPPMNLARRTIDALSMLTETRVFICSGNHDPARLDSPYRALTWPDSVTLFSDRTTQIDWTEAGMTIHGAGFTAEAATSPLFDPADHPLFPSDAKWRLLLLHGDVLEEGATTVYNPIPVRWLAQAGFHYAALGHRHVAMAGGFASGGFRVRETPLEAGKTRTFDPDTAVYAYSGCLAGRGFDETGIRGYLDVRLRQTGSGFSVQTTLREVLRPARQMIRLAVTVSEEDEADVIADHVADAVRACGPDADRHLYQIELRGRWPVDVPLPIDRLVRDLRPTLFYVEIRDRTQPAWDLESWSRETSLRGAYIRQLQQMLEQARVQPDNEAAIQVIEQAMELGLEAVRGEVSDHAPY